MYIRIFLQEKKERSNFFTQEKYLSDTWKIFFVLKN